MGHTRPKGSSTQTAIERYCYMDVSESKIHRRQVVLISEVLGRTPVGPDRLEGFIFNDCQIIGPAVLMPVRDTHFNDCTFEAAEVFTEAEDGRPYFGVVGLVACTFERCRFERIGIHGPKDFVDQARGALGS